MQIILITGISGSGKSVALNALEDAGYFCVDNLPPVLLPKLVATRLDENSDKLAVAVDSRSAGSLDDLPKSIQSLKDHGHEVRVLFLTSDTQSLITRFSETRRSHPLSHRHHKNTPLSDDRTLTEAIREERELMADIQMISHVIDTSNSSANELRNRVKELVNIEQAPLTLLFASFGFKFGVPLDADIMFDVRCLPNPYYDTRLRHLTGKDAAIRTFMEQQPEAAELLEDIRSFIEKWLPSFRRDNRSYLTIALGCTGGQHRSVYMVERLADHFRQSEQVVTRHRELKTS